jgi:hypothetical protein
VCVCVCVCVFMCVWHAFMFLGLMFFRPSFLLFAWWPPLLSLVIIFVLLYCWFIWSVLVRISTFNTFKYIGIPRNIIWFEAIPRGGYKTTICCIVSNALIFEVPIHFERWGRCPWVSLVWSARFVHTVVFPLAVLWIPWSSCHPCPFVSRPVFPMSVLMLFFL